MSDKSPPRLTPEGWSHFAKTRPRQDENKALTVKSFARYRAWRTALPLEANAHVCEPFLDVLFRSTIGRFEYKCTKCCIQRSLVHFRGHPCNARPEPRAVSHFLTLIGKAPDTIAKQQRQYRTIKHATTKAAAKRDEQAKKSRYDALRYQRKRSLL